MRTTWLVVSVTSEPASDTPQHPSEHFPAMGAQGKLMLEARVPSPRDYRTLVLLHCSLCSVNL